MNMSVDSVIDVRAGLVSFEYPSSTQLVWPGGYIDTWDAALVEVTLGDGTTGVGEVTGAIMAAPAVPGIVEALKRYVLQLDPSQPTLAGDQLRNMTLFWAQGGISNGVIGAVEMALLDAVGKREGVPSYELLGGALGGPMTAYASCGIGEGVDDVRRWVEQQQDDGFEYIKFRGRPSVSDTEELLAAVVPSLNESVRFMLDAVQGSANRAWSEDQALAVGEMLADLDAYWYEEPCQASNVEGYGRMVEQLQVPVSGVESFPTPQLFERLVEFKGADILQPDVGIIGGAASFMRVAELADRAGLRCVPHVWGTGAAIKQAQHVAVATKNVDMFELCTLYNPLRDALYVEPLRIDGGRIELPTAPGLGVATLADVEARFPFLPGRGHVIV